VASNFYSDNVPFGVWECLAIFVLLDHINPKVEQHIARQKVVNLATRELMKDCMALFHMDMR
jgi:hypothetical protein